jgi:hypothetical protein
LKSRTHLAAIIDSSGSGRARSGDFKKSSRPRSWARVLAPALAAVVVLALLVAAPAQAKETHVFKESFASAGAGNGQLALAAHSGLAINSETEDLYVADTGNGRVERFEANGTFVAVFGTFTEPTFVAIDNSPGGEGDVYVADTATSTVSKFEADGTPITTWGTAGQLTEAGGHLFENIKGIAVGPAGRLFVLVNETQLLRLEADGTFLDELTLSRLTLPLGIAVDPTGKIFKVNIELSVQEYGPAGENLGTVTPEGGAGGLAPSAALGVDPATGDLYVATTEKAELPRHAIDRYAFNGSGEVLEPGGGTCVPQEGVGCLPTDSFGSEAESGGEIESPAGLAVGPAGAVYLGDAGKQRIDLFDPVTVPDVTTEAATELKAHSAQLNGTVTAAGGVATCRFLWGTTEALSETPIPCISPIAAGATEPVSVTLTGLAPNTTYFFRLEAENPNGLNPGEASQTQHFTTPGPAAIAATFATEVSADSATLNAGIEVHGVPTSYRFDYGTTPAYGTSVPIPEAPLGSGTSQVSVSQRVQGLLAATTYHFRVVTRTEIEPGVFEETHGPDTAFTTQTTTAFPLPDGRQWQLVSPPDKRGGVIEPIVFPGVVQSAADGSALSYFANAPTETSAAGYSFKVQALSTRDSSGWGSTDIATPHRRPTGGAGGWPEYVFFSADLSAGLIQPWGVFNPNLSPEASEQTPFLRVLDGCQASCYRPVITAANALPGFGEELECEEGNPLFEGQAHVQCGPRFVGSTADLAHIALISKAPLVPDAGRGQLYEWSDGAVQQVSLLPENEAGEELPPANGGNEVQFGVGRASNETSQASSGRHAISADGSRVIWTWQGVGLYLRDTTADRTLQLDLAEEACLEAGECESGGGRFQIASADGSRVFFTDEHRLTADASQPGGADLYECEIIVEDSGLACDLTDLTPELGGERSQVLGGVLGSSEDGSDLYFVANGRLADNVVDHGAGPESAQAGNCELNGVEGQTCNLYRLHEGTVSFIAILSGVDAYNWFNQDESQPVRISASGRWLAFMSSRSLTGYDNRDAVSGQPDAEIYEYDASTGRLSCASCDPSGARPHGMEASQLNSSSASESLVKGIWNPFGWVSAMTPANSTFQGGGHQSRVLSDSGRLFFNSLDALVPGDSNSNWDVYQSEPVGVGTCSSGTPGFQASTGACLGLISAGTSGKQSAFLDASESGADVFFLTSSRLDPSRDVDSARDVYDAHECSAEVPCFPAAEPPPPACAGDACQQPATPPVDATPGSLTFNGAGNLKECPKGKQLKKGKCVKKKHHKKKSPNKHSKSKRTAGHKSGGGK